MLKNKYGLLITNEECNLIDAINCDNDSGRHLLSKRSEEYWNMRVTMEKARLACLTGNASEKEKQLVEYQKQSSDYSYWKNLPDEKKLFFEID